MLKRKVRKHLKITTGNSSHHCLLQFGKAFSCCSFPSLLQDGQLPRLEEGLSHPHGEDVHFGVHNGFLFLQQICRIKKRERKKEREKVSEFVLFPIEKSLE